MSELTEHDRRLLGLDEAWRVTEVEFQPDEKRVEVAVAHGGGPLTCPVCQAACTRADRDRGSAGRDRA